MRVLCGGLTHRSVHQFMAGPARSGDPGNFIPVCSRDRVTHGREAMLIPRLADLVQAVGLPLSLASRRPLFRE